MARGVQVRQAKRLHVRRISLFNHTPVILHSNPSYPRQRLTTSQTPTFNATPVVHAALEACKRGILVEIYADLGFNDEVSAAWLLLEVCAVTVR